MLKAAAEAEKEDWRESPLFAAHCRLCRTAATSREEGDEEECELDSQDHITSAKKVEKETDRAPERASGACEAQPSQAKQEEEKRRLPHYLQSTAASLAKQQPPVKREDKKMALVSVGLNGEGEAQSTTSLKEEKRSNVTEENKEEVRRALPHYLRPTAASVARQQPPVKREEKTSVSSTSHKTSAIPATKVEKEEEMVTMCW